MVALVASLLITGLMVGAALLVAQRRKPGQPLTWGEAFVGATFLFALLFVVYGVVPHQWLTYADKDLRWRSDTFGIPVGPLDRWLKNPAFEDGLTFFGRGRIMINAQTIRDVIAGGIYVVFLGAQIYAWSWWQKRGRKPATPELGTSAYGRPLVRRV